MLFNINPKLGTMRGKELKEYAKKTSEYAQSLRGDLEPIQKEDMFHGKTTRAGECKECKSFQYKRLSP